jgi:hypothetical protein
VSTAGDVTHEGLIRAERVSVRAAAGRAGHPLAVRGSDEVADIGHTTTLGATRQGDI